MKNKLVFVNLIPFHLLMIAGMITAIFTLPLNQWIISFCIAYVIAIFQTEIGIHRYFSHASFQTNKIVHVLLAFVSTVSMAGNVIAFAVLHNMHHKHSDTEHDLHSPTYKGFGYVYFINWFAYKYPYNAEFAEKIRQDTTMAFFEKYFYVTNIVYLLTLITIGYVSTIDMWTLVFTLYIFPAFISINASSIVNTYLHRTGDSVDSKLLSWILWGGGSHDEHHNNPKSSRLSFPDLAGFTINLISKTP